MYFRYVDENGNNYNVTMNIEGPYGPVSIFTGPKVRAKLFLCTACIMDMHAYVQSNNSYA